MLIIAEKNDAAKRIAFALDPSYKKLSVDGVPVYTGLWNSTKIYVIPARGHIYTLKTDVAELSLFPVLDVEWVPVADGYVVKLLNVIKKFIKESSEIIIACDYDIEGETIGYNIVKYNGGFEKIVKRAKFSTLTVEELKQSFNSLLSREKWLMADAGRTRHYIDYIWGISLSRLLMNEVRRSTGKSLSLSIGRVQGPTLIEIYNRESEINSYVPKPYWKFKAIGELRGQKFELSGPNLKSVDEVEVAKKLKGKYGKVVFFDKDIEEIKPPYPFNLSDLQKEAYRLFGIQPWESLSILEKLYLSALISYPRTSSQKLPPTINYRSILSKLGQRYKEAGNVSRSHPVEGPMDDPAHPAIYPTGELQHLTGSEYKIYDLVARRFISSFYRNVRVAKKYIKVRADGFDLEADGAAVIDKGWLEVYPFREIREKSIPDAAIGEEILIKDVNVELTFTKPPSRYTPSSLLEWMETNEIGTKATRAEIIKTLYKRGYIRGNKIEITELGFSVARYFSFSQIITLEMTRKLEKSLEDIEFGKAYPSEILKESAMFLIEELKKAKYTEEMVELTKKYLAAGTGESFGKCPVCGKGDLILHVSQAGKRYLKCSVCGASAPLPRKGKLASAKKNCSYCGWPLIKRGDWVFCPNPNCPSSKLKNA
ncbi:MAG: DNA topoisomerase I [Nitrososphaeria archaeon]|nr:DNA topoisomerase I [Nitrososphaerota archaeon]